MEREDLRRSSWYTARTFALLLLSCSLLTNLGWYLVKGVVYWHWVMTLCLSVICCFVIFRWPKLSLTRCATISLVLIGAGIFSNTLTNYLLAVAGDRFEAFGAYKLVPMAVAVVNPSPKWLGYTLMGACAIFPFVLYFAVLSPDLRKAISVQEPWYSLVFVVVAFLIFRHRIKTQKLEIALARMQANQHSLSNLARIFLGLRDLTNTPLQSFELTTHLLETGNISAREGADHLHRSLTQLRELSQILNSYEKDVDWSDTLTSFDATKLIQSKMSELQSGL